MIKKLHHEGFEVENLDKAIQLYESLGFTVRAKFEYPEANFQACMMISVNGGSVELFEFHDKQHAMYQKVRRHTAFESDDIEADMQRLLQSGYELAIPLREGKLVKRYAYLKDQYGMYIELLEENS